MVCNMENSERTGGGGGDSSCSGSGDETRVENVRQSPKAPGAALPPPALLQRNALSLSLPRKIMGKNNNNTVFSTSYPSNLAELQLYRVMQNASLLLYYDTLLEMGGDDVQQLCDACEEEFLEIMSLVGMASKPLHVRRLQKSLQEYVTNPAKFKQPLIPGDDFEMELSSPRVTSNHMTFYSTVDGNDGRAMYSPSPGGDTCALPPVSSPGLTNLSKRPYSPMDSACPPSSSSSPGSVQLTPTLMENQVMKLAAAAEQLSTQLPQFEPKPHNAKKKVCKELDLVMSMPESDPRRMDEIRRYAAIYGRFDCKRRPEKPLTLHEVSVNEAAAQICRFMPALLTRRDELFPLARQVVKDSGCYYAKTQITSLYSGQSRDGSGGSDGVPLPKKLKLESHSSSDGFDDHRQEISFDDAVMRSSFDNLFQHHSKNHHQTRDVRMGSLGVDLDDNDSSHFSYSNSNSPQDGSFTNHHSHKNLEQQDSDDASKFSPKVIAASGDNIIAVANPALVMSPTIIVPILEKD